MSGQHCGKSSAVRSYSKQLREAIGTFLPRTGLPLLSGDRRVRWTSRMLAIAAVLIAWSAMPSLLDRFAQAWGVLVLMYPTRRRPGTSVEGLFKALERHGAAVLAVLCQHWRSCLTRLAGSHWKIHGWLIFGVDGSKIDCPRTEANEQGFGVSGKNNSGPQQLLTCLFHLATGVLWGWQRDGVQGRGEPTQLKAMLHLLPPGALLVADAGYVGYDLLKALIDQGNSFLIRVGSNVTLIKDLGYAVFEGKQTVYLWPLSKQGRNKRSMPKTLGKVRPPLVLRLIRLKDARGKTAFLLTNVLERRKLSDHVAEKIYRLRWGVELMWRNLKQTMGHHKTLSKTPARAGVELDWAMAGLWMLQLLAASRMIQRRLSPLNHSPAQVLRVLRGAMSGRQRRGKSLMEQLGLATKDTYRRTTSKQARYRRQKRPQRPPGSPKARTATALEKQLIQRIMAQPPPEPLAA